VSSQTNTSSADGLLSKKLVHLALPVRWSLVGREGRGAQEMACTYDIHPQGARLLSGRDMTIGDMVMIERGRNKAICQVIWSADPESPLRGQFTVHCVEGKTPWDDELQQMEEHYQPVLLDSTQRLPSSPASSSIALSRPDANRRRRPRFRVQGHAEVIDGAQHLAGELQQISEYGARLSAVDPLPPGTDFRLMLSVFDVRLSLKAEVKYLVNNLGMGVEFHEIRRGDRPLLSYILNKVKGRRVEDFARPMAEAPQPAAV
jgi:PilZ domain